MTEQEIEIIRTLIRNAHGSDNALVWRDVDGGIHEVIGFNPKFKEHPEDHLSEPAFILRRGGCVAAYFTEFERFYFLSPAPRAPSPTSTQEQEGSDE
jgi:hypothetical protein